MTTILKNASGVRITEKDKKHGHHLAVGALCHCGGYIHSTETVQGRAAWLITEKGNDYLKK